MAENVRVITVDTGVAQTSVKELRNELKKLKDTLLSTEKGTEEYNEALQKAADISHTLKEQTEELNASAMDFGQITGNLVKATGGLVAGLQAVKASMNLLGIENEDVIKSLEKMQNLMALTQALPSIDNGIKAFKRLGLALKSAVASANGLKAAFITTGIGAAIVAVGLLAANWDKVSDALKKWGVLHEDTQKKLEERRKKIEEISEELKKAKQAYDNWEKNDKISKLNKQRKEEYELLSNAIEGYKLKIEEIGKAQQEAAAKGVSREDYQKLLDEGNKYLDLLNQAEKTQREILADEMSYIETVSNADIFSDEALLKWREKIEAGIFGDKEKKALKIPVDFVEPEDEDVSAADALKQKIEATVESLRGAFKSPDEQYQEEINALDVALKTKLIKEEEYLKLRDALNKEQTQREVLRYATAANGIGDIFSNLGELMEEGSEEQKAMQIMGATINMLAGITAAIAGTFTTHSGVWDIALAAIQATAIATSGAATIAKMAKTTKSNASSMGKSTNSAAIGTLIAPVQYTQDIQGASIEGAIKDTKVYVTETDISNTQNKVKVTENEAFY